MVEAKSRKAQIEAAAEMYKEYWNYCETRRQHGLYHDTFPVWLDRQYAKVA